MSSKSGARVHRLLAILLTGALAAPALLGAHTLAAHTALRRSEPAAGSILTSVPTRLVLEFTEVVALPTARIVLLGPMGDTVTLSALRHADSTRRIVVAEIVDVPAAGEHTVEWTVAGTDGHPVRGLFGFTIDSLATGLSPAESSGAGSPGDSATVIPPAPGGDSNKPLDASSPIYVAARLFGFAAMLGVLGALVAGRLVVPRVWLDSGAREGLVEGARRFGLLSAAALLVFAAARLVLQSTALRGVWDAVAVRELLTGTVWGVGWFLQAGGALVTAIALAVRRPNPFGPTAMVATLAIAVAAPLSGHPVALPDNAALGITLDAIHVLAAGGWIGGLAVLLLGVVPAAYDILGGARYDTVRRVFVAFTPVALTSGALLVLSGAGGAWLQLGAIEPLLQSTYGRLLLVKAGIVLVLMIFGFFNWRRVVPRIGNAPSLGRLRMTAGTELALAVVALLVTAVLVATTPPNGVMP